MNRFKNFGMKIFFALAILTLISFSSCDNDNELTGDEYVNKWIYENMEYFYLWNKDIPSKPNKSLSPDEFFESLLSDEDRFSWIQENYEELLNSLQGVNKEAGYEFILYRENPLNENVIAQIVYIKSGSPASSKDLVRGDVITKINGEQMTLSNYQSLLGLLSQNHSITYKRSNGEGVFTEVGTISLSVVEYAENPNFMHTVINSGDRKVGYYVYNFFANGPTQNSTQYNTEMDDIFSYFKAQGITDLVLDLRYNSGGSETATVNLASLIGNGIDNTKQFANKQYNALVTNEILNTPDLGPDFLVSKFLNKTQNVGGQLSGKVYVLTRNRTASASELLINGLKPYMNVVIVGDTTVGKNVGSISLYKENDPKNTWGMQPIVVKIFNSLNQSDYSEGFIPDVADDDNSLELLPIGDPNENLLSLALAEINGSGGRQATLPKKSWERMLGSSLDKKRRGFDIQIDDVRLKELLNTIEFSN